MPFSQSRGVDKEKPKPAARCDQQCTRLPPAQLHLSSACSSLPVTPALSAQPHYFTALNISIRGSEANTDFYLKSHIWGTLVYLLYKSPLSQGLLICFGP